MIENDSKVTIISFRFLGTRVIKAEQFIKVFIFICGSVLGVQQLGGARRGTEG